MTELLTALSVIFVIGGAFLLVGDRLGLPSAPFFILAGLLAGRFIDEAITLELARYGIALLVFTFGARIQVDTIRTVLVDSEVAAIGQFAVTGALGLLVGIAIGVPTDQALYLGIATALSSTIVGRGLVQADIWKNLVHGRLAESIHFVQDLLAILLVLVLGAEAFATDPLAAQIGYGVVLIGAAIIVNRTLFDHLGRLAGSSDELMLVGVIALLVTFLTGAAFVGVSIVVGAFAAGLAVRHDPARYLGMLNGLESITDFFVAIFFVTLGALVSLPTAGVLLMAGALGILTAVIKPAITVGLLLSEGFEGRSAILTGLTLDQVSEFALIIAIEALVLGVLVQPVFDAIILAAAVTMITSSLTHRYNDRIYRALAAHGLPESRHAQVDARSAVSPQPTDHVIIVGFGRQGRRLVEACEAIDRAFVVIENDPALLDELEAHCPAYVFGDAMEGYTWEKANVAEACLIVSTVESIDVSDEVLGIAGATDVILRARTADEAMELLDRGALWVAVPDLLAAEQLVELLEAVIAGERSPEALRDAHRAMFEEPSIVSYHTMADEIRAMR